MSRGISGGENILHLKPISLKEAKAFVAQHHRHHKPVVGHKFSVSFVDMNGTLHGVAIVGRPVSRHLDDELSLEVNRLCTDGTKNACTILYAAAWRVAQGMGYKRMFTFILETESGASLRAAGWDCDSPSGGKNWTGERYRQEEMLPLMKIRYSKYIGR